jgi:hypothetical protein
MWRSPDDAAAASDAPTLFGRGSAILADGRFIALGERGTLALLEADPNGLRERSRATFAELGYPCWTAPVLANKRLFITGARAAPGGDGFGGLEYHLLAIDLAAP